LAEDFIVKLWDILKTVGSAALQVALPGTGSLIVGAVNEFLPDDKKLPAGATGDDIGGAISRLPAADQASIMEKEFDVEITQIKESHSTVRAMLDSDAKNPQSTRPYIAKGSFHVVAFSIIAVVSVWSYGVISGDSVMVKEVVGGWPFIIAVIGPLVTLLWAYFGILKQEHKNKLDAANGGSTPAGLSGILSKILNRR
jgi:hypothetical protein